MNVRATCPDGHTITGTLEDIPGVALISWFEVGEEGLNWEYDGYTEPDWNGQETVYRDSEPIFVCDDGKSWKQSELTITEDSIEKDENE